jgi:hypothetical protein
MAEAVAAEPCLDSMLCYFEEPESGVPDGCTGWYHSVGGFELRSPDQAFEAGPSCRKSVRDDVAGPFCSREEAVNSLIDTLG